jgi:hypothetical protein
MSWISYPFTIKYTFNHSKKYTMIFKVCELFINFTQVQKNSYQNISEGILTKF